MKIILFAGTPGSGKTSSIKHTLSELKKDHTLFFAKFDCLNTVDDQTIAKDLDIETEKKLAGQVCPDHYMALEIPKIIRKHHEKDILLLETAGLCLRCSPYVKEGLGVNILDITAGDPSRYGPILTEADVIALSKGDLISQAEREIFRTKIISVNPNAKIIEVNGLTGEGALDLADTISNAPAYDEKPLTLKHSMPSAICGYCYGNKTIQKRAVNQQYRAGSDIKKRIPNINCGKCGYTSCNEFIRAILAGDATEDLCPFIRPKGDDTSPPPRGCGGGDCGGHGGCTL